MTLLACLIHVIVAGLSLYWAICTANGYTFGRIEQCVLFGCLLVYALDYAWYEWSEWRRERWTSAQIWQHWREEEP